MGTKKKHRPEKPISEILDSLTKQVEWKDRTLPIHNGTTPEHVISEISRFIDKLDSEGLENVFCVRAYIEFRGHSMETDEEFEARKRKMKINILASRKAKRIRSKQRKLEFKAEFKLYKKLRKKFEGGTK